jgi:hypothetical protein
MYNMNGGNRMKRFLLQWMILVGFLLFLFGLHSVPLHAEEPVEINITGTVLNFQKEPLEGVSVALSFEGILISTTTDKEGIFAFRGITLPNGETTVTVSAGSPGYEPWRQHVDLTLEKGLQIIIILTPDRSFMAPLLLAPALLGLIAWLAIRTRDAWGRMVALTILTAYFAGFLGWVALAEEWVAFESMKDIPIFLALILTPSFVYWRKHQVNKVPTKLSDETDNERDSVNSKTQNKGAILGKQAIWFTGTSVSLWALTIAGFLYAYLQDGTCCITLFSPSLQIPFIIPLFALLGLLVYASASIYKHSEDDSSSLSYRRSLLATGERILIGPYIAIIADLILFHPFVGTVPTLSEAIGTLPLKAFLAFLTGLYVKTVLIRLNQIGFKLLTKEAQLKKENQKKEKEDELVRGLKMSLDLAQNLRDSGVNSIEDLKNLSEEKTKEITKKIDFLTERKLKEWKKMAFLYMKEEENPSQ